MYHYKFRSYNILYCPSSADLHSQDSTFIDHGTVLRDYVASNQQHVRSHGWRFSLLLSRFAGFVRFQSETQQEEGPNFCLWKFRLSVWMRLGQTWMKNKGLHRLSV